MATKFLDPGGDAAFGDHTSSPRVDFWDGNQSTPTVVTDFVHGGHIRSTRFTPNALSTIYKSSIGAAAGTRVSIYLYIAALPTSSTATFLGMENGGGGATCCKLRLTTGGVLQLWEASAQIGSNGATLSTGTWYRISLALTVTSTTVNRFEVFVDGISSISVTNATITNIVPTALRLGNHDTNVALDTRVSDIYVDDSATLVDTGNIWVTAKRPNANGTLINWTTQIGAGGSGYGSGHSPQVNERPLSTTNGWSTTTSSTREEYNIESASTGDISTTGSTYRDLMGWWFCQASSAVGSFSFIVDNVTIGTSLVPTSPTMILKYAGQTTFPAGTGTDVGIISASGSATFSLYECGVVVAYIPPVEVNLDLTNAYNSGMKIRG